MAESDPRRPLPRAPAALSPETLPTRVWDLATRLFHWSLVVCVLGSVVSAKAAEMDWHFRFGYAVFALLAFRIVWGLIGGRWSRFASFLYGPAAVLRYLRGTPRDGERMDVGHNPLGALSVLAMLAVLVVQVGTGLIGDDEIANVGPLNRFVATDTGLAATSWHHGWGQWLLLGLIGLHIAAIVGYALRGQRLLAAMIGGDKDLPPGTPASADGTAARVRAAVLLALCALGVWGVISLGG